MEKYKAIRQLMAEGEFRMALDHLARILQKNPDDKAAKQLEFTCREMIHIQNACNDEPEPENDISVGEYAAVHFRRIMKKICRGSFSILNKLPPAWQQKIKPERFKLWEERFTVELDSQKDWMWELLFWDAKRRIIVFASLITAILLCILLFILLASGGCRYSETSAEKDFSAMLKSAYNGDANSQFSVGKNFYYGESVKKDVDQALFWLTKSARSRHTQAAALLQKILVEQDIRLQEGQYIWQTADKKKSGEMK